MCQETCHSNVPSKLRSSNKCFLYPINIFRHSMCYSEREREKKTEKIYKYDCDIFFWWKNAEKETKKLQSG